MPVDYGNICFRKVVEWGSGEQTNFQRADCPERGCCTVAQLRQGLATLCSGGLTVTAGVETERRRDADLLNKFRYLNRFVDTTMEGGWVSY
jgi:hypothetical protein